MVDQPGKDQDPGAQATGDPQDTGCQQSTGHQRDLGPGADAEPGTDVEHVDGEQSRPPRRRLVIGAAVLAALVAGTAVAAGTLIGPLPSPSTTAKPEVLPLDALGGSSARTTPTTVGSSAPVVTSTPPPGQQPGTIRLAEGGTARLVRKEITSDGTLPIPESLGEAAWWGVGLGAPQGAAVLSGHVNWRGRTGPFDELWRSAVGQPVEILDAEGTRWTYRVTEVLTLHKNDLPRHAERLFNARGAHRVVLVTCGGDFVGGTDGYRDNRVVVAEPVQFQGG